MLVKITKTVTGAFHVDAGTGKGWPEGVRAGEIIDLPAEHARRYCRRDGIAEPVNPADLEAHY